MPTVSVSLASKTNTRITGVTPSPACLTHASKDLYDCRRLCHYHFCPKGAARINKN